MHCSLCSIYHQFIMMWKSTYVVIGIIMSQKNFDHVHTLHKCVDNNIIMLYKLFIRGYRIVYIIICIFVSQIFLGVLLKCHIGIFRRMQKKKSG